jgi:DUF1680 family protein
VDPSDWSTANWHGFIPGHSFGQYVSGLSRGYAASPDAAVRRKIGTLVEKYAATISPRFFDDYNLPAYTFDKLMVGLLDAHRYASIPTARATLARLTDSAIPYLPEKALTREERRARPYKREAQIWDEPYTLPENLYLASQAGLGDRYRTLARKYIADDSLFDALGAGRSPFKGKHAYSHVNALSSAFQTWLDTGDEKYLAAARNGFAFIQAQSFATGGWGPNETLLAPDDTETLLTGLASMPRSFETPCGAYGHFKIARYLLQATGDAAYGDSMERVLYNCILGAKPIKEDGHGFYYSDYNNDGSKAYHPYQWHCCTGTFSQVTADYGISSYFHDGEGVYVNLYVPSRVTWPRAGGRVVLTQKTNYPLTPVTEIAIETDKAAAFPVYLRIPAWAGAKTSIAVNGKRVAESVEPGKFARVERTWKKGDRIEIEFDMQTTLEAVDPQHPNLVAPVHGPLALFSVRAVPTIVRRTALLSAAQVAAGSTDWQAKTETEPIALRPFTAIGDEHYRLYLNVEG